MNPSEFLEIVSQSANYTVVASTIAGLVVGALLTTKWYKSLPENSKAKEVVDVVRDVVISLMEISQSVKDATGGKLPEEVAKNLKETAVNAVGEKIKGFTDEVTRELVGNMVDSAVEQLKSEAK